LCFLGRDNYDASFDKERILGEFRRLAEIPKSNPFSHLRYKFKVASTAGCCPFLTSNFNFGADINISSVHTCSQEVRENPLLSSSFKLPRSFSHSKQFYLRSGFESTDEGNHIGITSPQPPMANLTSPRIWRDSVTLTHLGLFHFSPADLADWFHKMQTKARVTRVDQSDICYRRLRSYHYCSVSLSFRKFGSLGAVSEFVRSACVEEKAKEWWFQDQVQNKLSPLAKETLNPAMKTYYVDIEFKTLMFSDFLSLYPPFEHLSPLPPP